MVVTVVCCGRAFADDPNTLWDPGSKIDAKAISAKNKVKTGETVVIAGYASDTDHWVKYKPDAQSNGARSGGGLIGEGTEPDRISYSWSSTGGVWMSSNAQPLVLWMPEKPGDYTLTLKADDDAPAVSSGSREDGSAPATVTLSCGNYCGEEEIQAGRECCEKLNPFRAYSPKKECCETGGIFQKYSIQNLDDCPNRVKNSNYTYPGPNGCDAYVAVGLPGVRNKDNPAGGPDTSFILSCNGHDDCWGHCGGPGIAIDYRKSCDQDFLSSMRSVCDKSNPLFIQRKLRCYTFATGYWFAVETAGAGNFTNGQKKACQCCK